MHQGEVERRSEANLNQLRDIGPAIVQIADGARREPSWLEDCRATLDQLVPGGAANNVAALVHAVNGYVLCAN